MLEIGRKGFFLHPQKNLFSYHAIGVQSLATNSKKKEMKK